MSYECNVKSVLFSFETRFSGALKMCLCERIAEMSSWVQKVHIHHLERHTGSHSRSFRKSGRQNGNLTVGGLQICDWWSTTDKRTEEKRAVSAPASQMLQLSSSIWKENGPLIDIQTCWLMHYAHTHIHVNTNTKCCLCVSSSSEWTEIRQ